MLISPYIIPFQSIEENFPIYDVGILLRKYLNKVTSFLSSIHDTIYNRYQHS